MELLYFLEMQNSTIS